ncbi:hypothetical protein BDQ12DRAFT_623119 [Crucibulum laeve]|uniref:Thioredoxin-like fold domain-containing protein n=1 Tax=Crucibulum laeve TaxID=68775 RepID=A0A5C3MHN9_9AGAR|nr:hypothetical protein BDQ12DRAFT_623119 [Crucibulum laeve]
MKFSLSILSLLAVGAAHAQYLSEGWHPGQATFTVTEQAAQPSFVPPPPLADAPPPQKPSIKGIMDLFDISNILTSKPVAALFEKAGINITNKVEEQNKLWDERIPLITDDNYKDMIVNEEFKDEQEEKDRTWIIVISVTAAKQDGVSKFLDTVFDSAYNESVIAGDLPHVRWGRIDYLNVTHITTKWNIWQAPYLVILRDRGQSLRFYKPQQLRLREEALREFLKTDGWSITDPWSGLYAPGGDSREYLLEHLATALTKIYNVTVLIPRWLFFVLSGSVASFMINLLHRGTKETPAKPVIPGSGVKVVKSTPSLAVEGEDVADGVSSATPSSPAGKKRGKKGKK